MINKILDNKTTYEENSANEENTQKYFYDKRKSIEPIIKKKILIRKDLSYKTMNKFSFKNWKSSIFNQ